MFLSCCFLFTSAKLVGCSIYHNR